MAVLWEVQTFQKPCEGRDDLWALTYVLNLSVDLTKITPLHFIRPLLDNGFLPKEDLSGENLGPLGCPWVTPACSVRTALSGTVNSRFWQQ